MTGRCSCACSQELGLLRDTVADLQRSLREVQSLLRERTAAPAATPTRRQYDAVLEQLPAEAESMPSPEEVENLSDEAMDELLKKMLSQKGS